MRTLLVGEGNFSFARALVRLFDGNGFGLTATAYDTREVCLEKYHDAADILQEVRGLSRNPSSRVRERETQVALRTCPRRVVGEDQLPLPVSGRRRPIGSRMGRSL